MNAFLLGAGAAWAVMGYRNLPPVHQPSLGVLVMVVGVLVVVAYGAGRWGSRGQGATATATATAVAASTSTAAVQVNVISGVGQVPPTVSHGGAHGVALTDAGHVAEVATAVGGDSARLVAELAGPPGRSPLGQDGRAEAATAGGGSHASDGNETPEPVKVSLPRDVDEDARPMTYRDAWGELVHVRSGVEDRRAQAVAARRSRSEQGERRGRHARDLDIEHAEVDRIVTWEAR